MNLKNPFILAIVVGALQYLATRYPDYRDAINAVLVGLGYGGVATIAKSLNGGSVPKNGNSSLPG